MSPHEQFPPIVRVTQSFAGQPEVADPPAAVAEAIRAGGLRERVRPGGSVALAIGSRGIAGIDQITSSSSTGRLRD